MYEWARYDEFENEDDLYKKKELKTEEQALDLTKEGSVDLTNTTDEDNLKSPLFSGIEKLEMAYDGKLEFGNWASGEYVAKIQLALHYLVMVKETLGVKWLSNEWFRFGASSLANDILMQICKQRTGIYQSKDYFSID